MVEPADNYYARLGITREATQAEIRRAYQEVARRMHPDVNPNPEATEQFIRVQEAFEVLSQPDKRAAYDRTLPERKGEEEPVTVSTLFSRTTLARIGEPQLIYVLLELRAVPGQAAAVNPPLNICLVLDRSTSMQGLRLDTLKVTARELIRQLRPQDYLSIVTFSDRAEVLVPATRGSDYEKIEARVSLLQAGGGTEIYNGLKAGYAEVVRNLSPSHVNHLILITDGRTYGDEALCLELADRAREQGITISGLGIGTEWNDVFLDSLTSKTGGSSVFVAAAEDIRRFLEEKFRGLGQIFAERLLFEFDRDPDVELKYAFRLEPEAGPLILESPLALGNVPRESSLAVLLEFLVSSVPSDAKRVRLADGRLKMNVPVRRDPKMELPLVLSRPTSLAIDPEPPPQRIVKAMSRLTLYRMQEQARKELAEGKVDQATRRLQNLATHLLSHGQRDLARTVLAEADRAQQAMTLSEQGEKRIKYGTRALLLPPNLEDTLG